MTYITKSRSNLPDIDLRTPWLVTFAITELLLSTAISVGACHKSPAAGDGQTPVLHQVSLHGYKARLGEEEVPPSADLDLLLRTPSRQTDRCAPAPTTAPGAEKTLFRRCLIVNFECFQII